jgi:hypothetical protein
MGVLVALISVDPGVHACGVAWWVDGALVAAELRSIPLGARSPDWDCVCEKPQVYRGSRVRAADLVDLAIAAGRMTGNLPTKYVLPAEWKGQVPKHVQHVRMWEALSDEEIKILTAVDCAKSLKHNVYDAVCLGLKELGRI